MRQSIYQPFKESVSGKYSLELLEPRVVLSDDGMAAGLITHDPAYYPAGLGAIEVVMSESADSRV